MKTLALICFLGFAAVLFAPSAHAQSSPDFIFSSFQCDPLSCDNRLGPTFEGSVSATFDGVCTGGAIGGIESEISAVIGIDPVTGLPAPCTSAYIARAAFETSRKEELDDFCEPFLIDTVTSIGEILNFVSTPVWHKELSASCDGGTTGITTFGTRPC